MDPPYHRGCWHGVSRSLFAGYRPSRRSEHSSPAKELYTPKGFVTHAASLRQTFVHCAIFLTAASRRSLGRISVPVWLVVLSDQLPIVALVGRYPTNKLIGRSPILKRLAALIFGAWPQRPYAVLDPVSRACPPLEGRLTTRYSPVRHATKGPLAGTFTFDLHVLSAPLAFVLSQDQTLRSMI